MEDYIEVDLGKKQEMPEQEVEEHSEKKGKVYYPRLWLSDIQVPNIGDEPVWVKALVCKKSYTERTEDGEKTVDCELEVRALKVPSAEKEYESGMDDLEVVLVRSMDKSYKGE